MDVFFVISGYLISGIILRGLQRGRFSLVDFYRRRIRRILPALILVSLATYAVGWLILWDDEYKLLGKHLFGGAAFVSNFVTMREAGYFDRPSDLKPLLHLWSLGIEEQFYFSWPLALALAFRRPRVMPSLLISIGAASFAANLWLTGVDPVAAFFAPLGRAWELLAGAGLAYEVFSGRDRWPAGSRLPNVVATSGLALIVAALVLLNGNSPFPGWWAVLPVSDTACLIAAGRGAWVNRMILEHRAAVFIGIISYPLYLWHWPLLAFVRIVSPEPPAWVLVGAVFLAAVLAWATFVLVERPMRFGGGSDTAKVVSLSAALAAIGAVGLVTYLADGLPGRLDRIAAVKEQEIRTPSRDAACRLFVGPAGDDLAYCRYTAGAGAKTIALIGDSHAHALYPGLAEVLGERGVETLLLANSGCPSFLGVRTGYGVRGEEKCAERSRTIIEFLEGRPEIRSVVIATRGPLYMTGAGYGPREAHLRLPLSAVDPAWRGLPSNELFSVALHATVHELRQVGKSVFYVVDVPELRDFPRNCLGRPIFFTADGQCDQSVSAALERAGEYRARVFAIADLTPLDTMPILCPAGECKIIEGGKVLYADTTHLSVEGSRYVARRLPLPWLSSAASLEAR